jgi:hypothetical protein
MRRIFKHCPSISAGVDGAGGIQGEVYLWRDPLDGYILGHIWPIQQFFLSFEIRTLRIWRRRGFHVDFDVEEEIWEMSLAARVSETWRERLNFSVYSAFFETRDRHD